MSNSEQMTPEEDKAYRQSLKGQLQALLPYKIWRFIYSPLRCKLGQHWTAVTDWGFGGAVIDLYCPGCQELVEQIPLDDATDEQRARVHELVGELGTSFADE